MAYLIAAVTMTLREVQGHLSDGIFYTVVQQIAKLPKFQLTARRTVSLRRPSILFWGIWLDTFVELSISVFGIRRIQWSANMHWGWVLVIAETKRYAI